MSRTISLNKGELNTEYIIKDIKENNNHFENFGIYKKATITPLYRSMGKNICAYKTIYGIFAIRNETAEKILVQKYE